MFGPSRYLSVPLLWPLLTPDQSRRRLLAVALWPSLRSLPVRSSAAGSLPQRPDHSVEQRSPLLLRNVGNRLPIRSPQVRMRCFRAQALHLPCPPYPMGFVMRCQLARRPGLLCSFCPSPRTFALRLPPDKPRGLALAFGSWLSSIHVESMSVLPQGTSTPSHRAHAGRTPIIPPDAAR